MCPEYLRLHLTWARLATPIDGLKLDAMKPTPQWIIDIWEADRKRPEYIKAKAAVIDHLATCEPCRKWLNCNAIATK